jgi:type II secretory pathway pseudopilin PulG
MKFNKHPIHAFTMIELLSSILIIAVLSVASVFFIASYISWSQNVADQRTLAVLNDALTRYKCEGGDIKALTQDAPISHVITALKAPLDWGGMTHSVMQSGLGIKAKFLYSKGNLQQYRFTKYNTYTAEDGGANPQSGVPLAPSNAAATVQSITSISVSWTDNSSDETGFIIQRAGNSDFSSGLTSFSADVDATSYTDSSCSVENTYYYRICAVGEVDNSAYTSGVSATIPTAPTAPTGLTATASSNTVTLSWTDTFGGSETNYTIQRATDSGFSANLTSFTTSAHATSYTDSSGAYSTTYYYRVYNTNIIGDSGYSNTTSVITGAPPVNFVAIVNGSTTAAYSGDGITWAAATLPSSATWQSVAYANGKFVAVGSNNSAAYSSDGITWTATTIPSTAGGSWASIFYGGGKFAAIGGTAGATSNAAAYSSDGITWTTATTLPSSATWMSVTYGNGKFVAVAYNSNKVANSSDGITWTTATTLPFSTSWYPVAYGNGKFVALAYGSGTAAYSSDGITWTGASGAMPNAYQWDSVAYGNGKFMAVAWGSGTAAYSSNGITWSAATLPSSASWSSVAYGNGKFVALAYNSNKAAYSSDGVTWTAATLPSGANWQSVAAKP